MLADQDRRAGGRLPPGVPDSPPCRVGRVLFQQGELFEKGVLGEAVWVLEKQALS
jgi:hypothetical protein